MRTSTKEQCKEWVNKIREQAYKFAELAAGNEIDQCVLKAPGTNNQKKKKN